MEKLRALTPSKRMGMLTFWFLLSFNCVNYCFGEMEIAGVGGNRYNKVGKFYPIYKPRLRVIIIQMSFLLFSTPLNKSRELLLALTSNIRLVFAGHCLPLCPCTFARVHTHTCEVQVCVCTLTLFTIILQ